jgi:hypothetical protein
LNWSNGIQHRQQEGKLVTCSVRVDNRLWRVECRKLRKIWHILNSIVECFLLQMYMTLQV